MQDSPLSAKAYSNVGSDRHFTGSLAHERPICLPDVPFILPYDPAVVLEFDPGLPRLGLSSPPSHEQGHVGGRDLCEGQDSKVEAKLHRLPPLVGLLTYPAARSRGPL